MAGSVPREGEGVAGAFREESSDAQEEVRRRRFGGDNVNVGIGVIYWYISWSVDINKCHP